MKTREELVNLGVDGFKADEIMLLQEKMMEQAVKFQFRKKDGSIRDAVGTLKKELMRLADGTLYEFKGSAKPAPANTVPFFDCVKGMWRSFIATQFIGLVNA